MVSPHALCQMYVSALKNKQILLQLTVDFSHLKRYYFDMKTRRPAPDDFMKGDTAMNICAAKNTINTGRRAVSAYSYFGFIQVCYADRYFAALKLSDRCERPEAVF